LKKREKYIGPRPNKNSISFMIFTYLKNGVSSREELIIKLNDYFKDNEITENSKNRNIDLKKIINNVNEILRYLFEKRNGWYKHYNLDTDKNKIMIRRIDNGNKKNTLHVSGGTKEIQDR
jgi:hypothetical protein